MTKTAKKRQSLSVERQLALALVAVLEMIEAGLEFDSAATDARAILKTHGYSELKSIPTRVALIEVEIKEALETKNYDALARLGQEMKRAEKGLPQLTTEKKPRKAKTPKATPTDRPAESKEPKTRKKRLDKSNPFPDQDGVPVKCGSCDWTGTAAIGSACPVDGYLVVAQEG